MPTTKPATHPNNMTDTELDQALQAAWTQRNQATTHARRQVLGTIIDRLLDERWRRGDRD